MLLKHLPLLGLFILSACTAPGYESTEWAIVGGEQTRMNEQATVAVLDRSGGLCTGTLISPRVVLTAKHCVQHAGASSTTAVGNFVIGVGDRIRGLSETFSVLSVWTTPGVYRDDGRLTGLVGIDVALITLRGEVVGVDPIPVHRGHPRDQFGQEMRAVGFGQTPGGGAGVKYRTMTTITSLMGNVIGTGPATCQGDSGGPLIVQSLEEVIGVTSFGSGGCGAGGFTGFNRIDPFLDDIDRVIRESGACSGVGEEICNGMDDDCDDMIDEGCLDTGETCNNNEECLSLRCDATDGGSICTESCDPLRPYLGCPSGLYCAQTVGCDGRCEPGSTGTVLNGESCTSDSDCESLFCTTFLGESVCLTPCEGGRGICFDGETCGAPVGACGGCIEEGVFAEPRGLGEGCDVDEDCASGTCFEDLGDSYCSMDCAGDNGCASGFHCRIDDARCVRGPRSGTGQGCGDNGDCERPLFCAAQGDASWCTEVCEPGMGVCPTGHSCIAAGDVSLCAPDSGTLGSSCTHSDGCVSGLCEPVGEGGASICTRACSPDAHCETGTVCVRQGGSQTGGCVPTDVATDLPPPSGGCCSVAGDRRTRTSSTVFGLLFGAILFVRSQRRRR